MRPLAAATLLSLLSLLCLVTGCGEQGVSSLDPDCRSGYQYLAHRDTRPEVLRELFRQAGPKARHAVQVGTSDGHPTLDVLDGRRHVLLQADVWRREDGTWVAGQYGACQ